MSENTIDQDYQFAAERLEATLPDPAERRLVLNRLVQSIHVARRVCPNAWAVTLFTDGFRLNVGQVEVLVLSGRILRVNLLERFDVPPFVDPDFRLADYHSMPEPQCAFRSDVSRFALVEAVTRAGHERFILRAGTTRSGSPVAGTRYRSSHFEGLVSYAEAFVSSAASDALGLTYWAGGDEVLPAVPLTEGKRLTIQVNAFERNARARALCIAHYKAKCVLCGFQFGAVYGERLDGFIHVHHVRSLADIGAEYVVDPVADLRPVCPNCHSVIHSRATPYTLEEVQAMLQAGSVADSDRATGNPLPPTP